MVEILISKLHLTILSVNYYNGVSHATHISTLQDILEVLEMPTHKYFLSVFLIDLWKVNQMQWTISCPSSFLSHA